MISAVRSQVSRSHCSNLFLQTISNSFTAHLQSCRGLLRRNQIQITISTIRCHRCLLALHTSRNVRGLCITSCYTTLINKAFDLLHTFRVFSTCAALRNRSNHSGRLVLVDSSCIMRILHLVFLDFARIIPTLTALFKTLNCRTSLYSTRAQFLRRQNLRCKVCDVHTLLPQIRKPH